MDRIGIASVPRTGPRVQRAGPERSLRRLPSRQAPHKCGRRFLARRRTCPPCQYRRPSIHRGPGAEHRGPWPETVRRSPPAEPGPEAGCSQPEAIPDRRRTPAVLRQHHRHSEQALAGGFAHRLRPCKRPKERLDGLDLVSALRTMRASGRRSICNVDSPSSGSPGSDEETAASVVVPSGGRPAITDLPCSSPQDQIEPSLEPALTSRGVGQKRQ